MYRIYHVKGPTDVDFSIQQHCLQMWLIPGSLFNHLNGLKQKFTIEMTSFKWFDENLPARLVFIYKSSGIYWGLICDHWHIFQASVEAVKVFDRCSLCGAVPCGELSHLMLNNSLDPDTILQINGENTMVNEEVERDKFILLLNEK